MNRAARIAASLFALVGAAAAAPAGTENDPAAYALRLAVRAIPGTLHRMELPAAILAAARTPDLADLRLFDASGRALPIARATPGVATLRHVLRPLPILAPVGGARVAGLSLRLDAAGQPRLTTLSATDEQNAETKVAGYLFDARKVSGRAVRLMLDADLPAGQPITFTVEAGATLRDWRTIAETVVYRAPGEAAEPMLLPLGNVELAGDYLRLSWRAGGRLLSPVMVRGATLLASGAAAEVTVDAMAPPLTAPSAIEFVSPFAVPIASIRVMPAAGEALVPIRILGRNDSEQPWGEIGSGVAGAGDAVQLGEARFHILRIEAAGAGFAAPPAIRFGFVPRAILFLAAGGGPFTLAAGRADTTAAYLPVETLTAGRGAAAEAQISAPAPRIQLAGPDTGSARRRTILLWGILLAATAALAGMAWAIWRRTPPVPAK